jgi:hypothetical protein
MPNASYAAAKGLERPTDAAVHKVRAGYAGALTWTDLQIGKVVCTASQCMHSLTVYAQPHSVCTASQCMHSLTAYAQPHSVCTAS